MDTPGPVEHLELHENATCLLSKYLTPELRDKFQGQKSRKGGTLLKCIKNCLERDRKSIGLSAVDPESYFIYSEVFDPIIESLHSWYNGVPKKVLKPHFSPIEFAENVDLCSSYVASVRISAARNISGFSFTPSMTLKEKQQVLQRISRACGSRIADLPGSMKLIGDLEDSMTLDQSYFNDMNSLEDASNFGEKIRMLGLLPTHNESKGSSFFSHVGKGLWCSDDLRLVVWINVEDHIRITATERVPSSVKSVASAAVAAFARVSVALSVMSKSMSFEFDSNMGYLTTSPSLLGTALTISLALKNISISASAVDYICDSFKISVQHLQNGTVILSNHKTLGLSEAEALMELFDCAGVLIGLEEGTSGH